MYARQVSKLRRIIAMAQALIDEIPKPRRGRPTLNGSGDKRGKSKRLRRTGKELVQFRSMLKAERKKGVPVAELWPV